MKKLIQTFQNIFKIEELKKRILYTLGLLLIYRFGSFVVIPGINPNALSSLADQVSGTGLLGLLDIFSGGAFWGGAALASQVVGRVITGTGSFANGFTVAAVIGAVGMAVLFLALAVNPMKKLGK